MPIRVLEPAATTTTGSRVRVIEKAEPSGYDKAKSALVKATQMAPSFLPKPVQDFMRAEAVKRLVAAQGAGLGWVDEAMGGAAAGGQALANLVKDTGISPRDAYRATRDVVNETIKQRVSERPVESTALMLAGGAATGGPAAKALQGATTLPNIMLRSAGVGAAYGGVSGAGAADEGERLEGATKGAFVGGIVGGAVPVAVRGAQTAGRAIDAATGFRLSGGPQGAAAGRLREALARDGVDEAQIADIVDDYTRSGAMPPTLADVAGENTRALLRYAGSRPGDARSMAQGYRDTTYESLPDASIERARALTQNQQPAAQYAEQMTQARGAVADQMYPVFKDVPVPVGDDVTSALSGETGKSALATARRIADARRDYTAMAEIDALADGRAAPVRAGTLDLIRRGIRDSAGQASRAGDNTVAGGLTARESDLENALRDVEGFDAARNMYRSFSQQIEGIDVGQRLLKDSPDDFAAMIGKLPGEALEPARIGGRQALTDALGKRSAATPLLRQIAMAPNARRNLVTLFGEDEANRFIQAARLNLEKMKTADFIAPNTNSQTFSRAQDAERERAVLDVVRRPIQKLIEKFAAGLTLTDAEAAQLVRLGVMKPEQAMAATQRATTIASPANTGRVTATTAALLGAK